MPPTSASSPVNEPMIKNLLEASGKKDQVSLLVSAGLFNQEGLSHLLDTAANLARTDPMQARHLSLACSDLARDLGGPLLLPKATYINAQTHAVMGSFTRRWPSFNLPMMVTCS